MIDSHNLLIPDELFYKAENIIKRDDFKLDWEVYSGLDVREPRERMKVLNEIELSDSDVLIVTYTDLDDLDKALIHRFTRITDEVYLERFLTGVNEEYK